MAEYARMPEAAFSFEVFGAAAGWLAAGFLATPIVNFTCGHSEPLFTAARALAAGPEGLHAHLDYRCGAHHLEDCREPIPRQIKAEQAAR